MPLSSFSHIECATPSFVTNCSVSAQRLATVTTAWTDARYSETPPSLSRIFPPTEITPTFDVGQLFVFAAPNAP